MKKEFIFSYCFLILCTAVSTAADLSIQIEDIRLVPEGGTTSVNAITGYHLYIRKKPGIESVLLTETTRDPSQVETNYAYRALSWNAVNGDEFRYLNGKRLTDDDAKFSVIDSTPEPDAEFGAAFHLFIPPQMAFGYPWTRNGIVKIGQGTFINVRAFGTQYGDYTNGFQDNPFMFDFEIPETEPEPPPPPPIPEIVPPTIPDGYNPEAFAAFYDIAGFNKGTLILSRGPSQLADEIIQSIDWIEDKTRADIVIVIDATGSMKDAFAQLKRELLTRLKVELPKFTYIRIGLAVFQDYVDNYRFENFPVKIFPFTNTPEELVRNFESITINGTEGGDIPEAVYEGLYVSMDYYPWHPDAGQKVILVGDAEPHPKPRGSRKYSKELIKQICQSRDITVDAILLPEVKSLDSQY